MKQRDKVYSHDVQSSKQSNSASLESGKKLPNLDRAYIPLPKLKEYLLSEAHPVGRSKAKFLRAVGFNETNLDLLEKLLIKIAQTQEVNSIEKTHYGIKYVIEGVLETPNGRIVQMRTIWIIEADQDEPRFITAYPA